MNLLLINNSAMTLKLNRLYCESNTGNFAHKLLLLGNNVTMYGQVVKDEDTIHSFDIKANNINTYGLQRKKNKLINYLNLYLQIIPLIKNSDFVYIYYPNAFKYTAFLCRLLNTPYGLYIRGEKGLTSPLSKALYKHSLVSMTISEDFTAVVKRLTKNRMAYTIKPMISFTEADIQWSRDYKQHPTYYKILYLGRIEVDKGIKELLLAVCELKELGYTFLLTIVGSGSFLPAARKMVSELGISDMIQIEGPIANKAQIKQYYLNADLYILPSYHEGFPRTLYEAMIFGTPIISTFVGSVSTIMKDNFNSLKISSHSVDSIVEGLSFSFNNYDKMIKYAKNGFNTVEPIISSKRHCHAEQLNKILTEVL